MEIWKFYLLFFDQIWPFHINSDCINLGVRIELEKNP